MKKVFFLLFMAVSLNSMAGTRVRTTCGKIVDTVSEEYFQGNDAEYKAYLREVNFENCGTYDMPLTYTMPSEDEPLH